MAPLYTPFPYIKKSVRNTFYPVIRMLGEEKETKRRGK